MINNIKIGYSPLTNELYLYRHGKDPGLALEKRPCEPDLFQALVQYMTDGMEDGAMKSVCFGDDCYDITVKKITREEFDKRKI